MLRWSPRPGCSGCAMTLPGWQRPATEHRAEPRVAGDRGRDSAHVPRARGRSQRLRCSLARVDQRPLDAGTTPAARRLSRRHASLQRRESRAQPHSRRGGVPLEGHAIEATHKLVALIAVRRNAPQHTRACARGTPGEGGDSHIRAASEEAIPATPALSHASRLAGVVRPGEPRSDSRVCSNSTARSSPHTSRNAHRIRPNFCRSSPW
jgi:hypothetical protein